MRTHPHSEDHIRHLKDSGLVRFPFTALDANRPWLQVIGWATALVRWFQPLCLADRPHKPHPRNSASSSDTPPHPSYATTAAT